MGPHFLSVVLCLLVQCFSECIESPLKPMYTSRKSKSEFFHSSIPFPLQSCLQGQGIQISVFSWEMVKGSDGTCRRILVWWSWDRGAKAWCSTCVPCRYTCDWVCRCSLLLCLTDTGRALARWWSLGYVLLPPHHFFNVKTVKVGGFGSGMVFHGTADELSLCKGLGGSVGACRMYIIKTHVINMQYYFLLFLWLRTLGFDLARPQAQAYH